MTLNLSKYLSPGRWAERFRRDLNAIKMRHYRLKVEALFAANPIKRSGCIGPNVIIADGMWDNPNYWLRLRLFLGALPEAHSSHLIGVLRTHADKVQRRMLESMGFREFIYTEEHNLQPSDFEHAAAKMLKDVKSHKDILSLDLPGGLPAYIYYDTVLKHAHHPRPALDDPLWQKSLAEVLCYGAVFADLFSNLNVTRVIVSHPWKSEYASLCWAGICHGAQSYHLTAYTDSIRIRRFSDQIDFASPIEHLPVSQLEMMSSAARSNYVSLGEKYLNDRSSGLGTDINVQYAFHPEKRQSNRSDARHALGVHDDTPVIVIYSHVWYDFPHTFAMTNFTDFLDWMQFTIDHIKNSPNTIWLLKPHPTDLWYDGFQLSDVADCLPPHVRICAANTDSLTTLIAADAVVTVHGTVGIEAAARGLPVIAADRSYYSDWDFSHLALSREHYASLLDEAQFLPPPNDEQRHRAAIFSYFAQAPHPDELGLVDMACDSLGWRLYADLLERYARGGQSLDSEQRAMSEWLDKEIHSYSVHQKLTCSGY